MCSFSKDAIIPTGNAIWVIINYLSWEYFSSVTAQSLIYYIYVSVLLPENMWGQITCTAPFVLNHARVNPQAVL
jgi:hypothetical protein